MQEGTRMSRDMGKTQTALGCGDQAGGGLGRSSTHDPGRASVENVDSSG